MRTNVKDHELLSVPEAAMALEISAPSLRRLIAQGAIPIVQLGGPHHLVRVRRDDVERLLTPKPRTAA
jgi:excisionase family DNA binding protein